MGMIAPTIVPLFPSIPIFTLPCVSVVVPTPCIPPQDLTPTPIQPRQGMLAPPDTGGSRAPKLSPDSPFSAGVGMSQLQSVPIENSNDKEEAYAALGGWPNAAESASVQFIQEGKCWYWNKDTIYGFSDNFVTLRTGKSVGLTLLSAAGTATFLVCLLWDMIVAQCLHCLLRSQFPHQILFQDWGPI